MHCWLWGRCHFLTVRGFFSFGCRFGAVAGWGTILGLGPAGLGLWEDVWVGGLARGRSNSRACCVGFFMKQYTN